MTHFDRLLAFAISRLKLNLPLPVDMEMELVERGYDIEALRSQYDTSGDNVGFRLFDAPMPPLPVFDRAA